HRYDLGQNAAQAAMNDAAGQVHEIPDPQLTDLDQMLHLSLGHARGMRDLVDEPTGEDMSARLHVLDQIELVETALDRVVVRERIDHAHPVSIQRVKEIGPVLALPRQQYATIGACALRTAPRHVRDTRVPVRPYDSGDAIGWILRHLEHQHIDGSAEV